MIPGEAVSMIAAPLMQAARIIGRPAHAHLLHPEDACLADCRGEFLYLATGQFGRDAGFAGIVQFEFDGFESDDHGTGTFRRVLTKG